MYHRMRWTADKIKLLLESPYVSMYPTERGDKSTFYLLAGRIMGGGSSVNVMSILRPTRHDLDTWAKLGNPSWSYDKMLPIMKRIEADQRFAGVAHGDECLDQMKAESAPARGKRPSKAAPPAKAPAPRKGKGTPAKSPKSPGKKGEQLTLLE